MSPDLLPGYAELHCVSNFSFLRGASHPEELCERAASLGYSALALTDECSLAGVVRAPWPNAGAEKAAASATARNWGLNRMDCSLGIGLPTREA